MPQKKCPHCNKLKDLKAWSLHIKQEHFLELEIRDVATEEVLESYTRSLNDHKFNCKATNCSYSQKNSQTFMKHYNSKHNTQQTRTKAVYPGYKDTGIYEDMSGSHLLGSTDVEEEPPQLIESISYNYSPGPARTRREEDRSMRIQKAHPYTPLLSRPAPKAEIISERTNIQMSAFEAPKPSPTRTLLEDANDMQMDHEDLGTVLAGKMGPAGSHVWSTLQCPPQPLSRHVLPLFDSHTAALNVNFPPSPSYSSSENLSSSDAMDLDKDQLGSSVETVLLRDDTTSLLTEALSMAGLRLVTLDVLGISPSPNIIICVKCQAGCGKDVLKHILEHDVLILPPITKRLKAFLEDTPLVHDPAELELPPVNCRPIEGLKTTWGYGCTIRNCRYACSEESTMKKHWNKDHKHSDGLLEIDSRRCFVQRYFRQRGSYFSVNRSLSDVGDDHAYALYLEQLAPNLAPISLTLPTAVNEIPPLLRTFQWHEHLKAYLVDRETISSLRKLISIPQGEEAKTWMGKLGQVVLSYLKYIRQLADDCPFPILYLLMECPRTKDTKAWQTLNNDSTMAKYGAAFQKLAFGILRSSKGHESGYSFPLTQEDKGRVAIFEDILKGAAGDAIMAFHDMIKPILYAKQSSNYDNYRKWDNVVDCFVAVYALRRDGNFRTPEDITQIFAQLHYFIRGTILYEGIQKSKISGTDTYKAVEEEAMKNLQPGVLSPYNTCADNQRYATTLANNSNAAPTTRVSQDRMTISYKHTSLHVPSWRAGLKRLLSEVEREVDEVCLNKDFGLQIPEHVPDDWSNNIRGYSWLQQHNFVEERCLFKEMVKQDKQQLLRVNSDNGKVEINTTGMWATMKKLDALTKQLALLIFFTAGQTPRVSEFIEHKISNSLRHRTIFRDGPYFWVVICRSKTESLERKATFRPTKMHLPLSRIFEKYIVIIRPLQAELAFHLGGKDSYQDHMVYLWMKSCKRMTPEEMRALIPKFLNNYCDVPADMKIGTQEYRQLVVEIGRIFLGSEFEVEQENLNSDVLAAQMGHSIRMARSNYAVEEGYLACMPSDLLLRYGQISKEWWNVTGVGLDAPPLLPHCHRQLLGRSYPMQWENHSNGPEMNGLRKGPAGPDIQSTLQAVLSIVTEQIHQSEARMVLRVKEAVMELPTSSVSRLASFQSTTPHPDILSRHTSEKMNPCSQGMFGEIEPQMPFYSSDSDRPDTIMTAISGAEIGQQKLQQLLRLHFPAHPNPTFKSEEQRKAVELALNRNESFVAVLPTGAGKSLIFTLPPFNEDGYQSYVIIPNKALLEDQIERSRRLGLKAIQWCASNPPALLDAQLVFLAMETAGTNKFRELWDINKKRALRKVIDEGHEVLLKQFRPQFDKLQRLIALPGQTIVQTASLPMRLENQLLEAYGLPKSTPIIRAPCTQPQISYNLVTINVNKTTPTRLAIDIARKMQEKLLEKDRQGIIFCASIMEVKEVETFTHCSSFSGLPEKQENEAKWKSGKCRWIAATTGLIHGIDLPNVGAVIFVGIPYGLLNVYQGAGRGGRDGRISWAIIITPDISGKKLPRLEQDVECLAEAVEWVKQKRCRRTGFSILLDGNIITCHDLKGSPLCDFCDPHSSLMSTINPLILDAAVKGRSGTNDSIYQDNVGEVTGGISQILEHFNDQIGSGLANEPSDPPTKSEFPSPTSAEPSIGSISNARTYLLRVKKKESKAQYLGEMASLLDRHCVICWAHKGELIPRHKKLWTQCCGGIRLPRMYEWMDFKKSIIFEEKYKYCYRCHLPQDRDNLSPSHPRFTSGGCTLEDFVPLLVWLIRIEKDTWASARAIFGLEERLHDVEFARWYVKGESVDSFCNGVELVLWFFRMKGKRG